MNGKNQVGCRGPPAQAVFPVTTELAIERLNDLPVLRRQRLIDQIVGADLRRVPIKIHVTVPMPARGDVFIQARAVIADQTKQMAADRGGRLFAAFEREHESRLSELALPGTGFNPLELLAGCFARTQPFEQSLLL